MKEISFSCKTVHIITKCPILEQRKPVNKRIAHCPNAFFDKVSLLSYKMKHTGNTYNDVGNVVKRRWCHKNDRWTGTKTQTKFLALRSKLRQSSSYTLTGRSFKILNVCMVSEKQEPVHAKHEKCNFVPRGEYSCTRNTNLNLIMQKENRVIQRILWQTFKLFAD